MYLVWQTCTKCGHSKPLGKFMTNKECLDGHGAWCLACFSLYMGKRIQIRQKTLDKAKDAPCMDCGRSLISCVLTAIGSGRRDERWLPDAGF